VKEFDTVMGNRKLKDAVAELLRRGLSRRSGPKALL
jgi:hypothetical protein